MLRQVVHDWAGSDAELSEAVPLAGGSINTTLLLTLKDGGRAVLKITPHRVDRAYEDEVLQLDLLRSAGVPTPQVHNLHNGSLEQPFSYLIMQFVEGVDLNAARGRCSPEQFDNLQRDLADLMLRLHAIEGPGFMRVSKRQVAQFDSWPAFYRDVFDLIWTEVAKTTVLPIKLRKVVHKLHDRLDRFLVYDGTPRLLHWDVWATNLLAAADGEGRWTIAAMLDPNCKYGCPEAELAYMDLFHTATPVFFKSYQAERRLPAEYHQVRKPIFQLYSLLNHVRLFGGDYARAVCAQAEKVATLL
ncbi:fructosamine kinase family protein [Humisphaera borealis]|uniref:Fructosamine kinase family protein n=1 Tax=Humisphaera borealis TaxID=2807512 RepID=A0A7M2X2V4_9BACT|nr:fructosamine kinase family protein [Humisphaera borealis]QOV91090.1 fructosamine kinase family protein [Humisphaera borealis]